MMKIWHEAFWKPPPGHKASRAQLPVENAKARHVLWLVSIGFLATVTIGMGLGAGSVFALANLISLTPGILTLDVPSDRRVLLLHAMAVTTEHTIFLDVVIVLALIAFLGTVAFAHFTERRGLP